MIAVLLAATVVTFSQDTLSPAARRVLADVRFLADDRQEGRGVGTAGLERSGAYIKEGFGRAGLRASFQDFTIPADAPAVLHTNLAGTATRNVVAVIPGSSPQWRNEFIVVGAHYDHLGMGGFGALDPDSTGRVHNGADDNASGTAALLEIGRMLSARTPAPARTIVLVAFSGEELGTLGSSYFVQHAVPQPIDSLYAMLNLDMVGRLRNARLMALGAATAREFPALLDSLNTPPRFDLRASGDGWGPSDHAVFFAAHHPVLHFFTDLHEDYHRSTDDWEKLNVEGLAQVAQFVADLAWALANRPAQLTFVDAPRPQASTGGSGYGAYLGTIPDMSGGGVSDGVRLTGVRAGSPAEQAGLTGGDVITAIGDKHIANLYDMTDALRSHQPGDTVVIVSRRGSVERRATTVLGKRGT
ncbi:MAG TPA: M20/M25/M40 family metallo-hydrolase [Gemmatimonadales bacterium]|nr:M20/M25/M40 family metallo-hydrolase [Gemmatimonadales bacterium]